MAKKISTKNIYKIKKGTKREKLKCQTSHIYSLNANQVLVHIYGYIKMRIYL